MWVRIKIALFFYTGMVTLSAVLALSVPDTARIFLYTILVATLVTFAFLYGVSTFHIEGGGVGTRLVIQDNNNIIHLKVTIPEGELPFVVPKNVVTSLTVN